MSMDFDVESGFARRLVAAMGAMPQKALAENANVSTSALSKYVRGEAEPQLLAAYRLAKVLGVNLSWLVSGEGPQNLHDARNIGVLIYDVQLAAGTASFADGARVIGEMPFDRDLLLDIANQTNSNGLGVLQAEGDSMEPLIADGARVLIDFRDTRLREGIFAFRLGDELRIKRLRRTLDGLEVLSENARYAPEHLAADRLEDFAIIGRAIWSGSPL